MMQLIGYLLILAIIWLFIYYFKWSKKEEEAVETDKGQVVTVVVRGAYSPNIIRTKINKPLILIFDRQEDSGCSKRVIIEDFGVSEELPDFGKKEITITPKTIGEFSFTCEMGMYQGKIIVEE